MTLRADSIIAIIGAGAMGSGIALVAAQAGHEVLVIDTQADALDRSRMTILGSLSKLVQRGKLTAEGMAQIETRLQWNADLAAAAPAHLVIEAIVEKLDVKTDLFIKLANIVATDAILATNTSSLPISAMSAVVPHPSRFAGLHFFNPVPVMKLVEVVPGPDTDEATTTQLLALTKAWGKVGVRVRDVPGFIVNRVARPYYAEGFAALGEGLDAASIDHALEAAGGFRMGPLALADMIGHDVNFTVAESVYEAYDHKTRFRPQPTQKALCDEGRFGRKSGRGVYDYSQPSLPAPAFVTTTTDAPKGVTFASELGLIAPMYDLTRTAGLVIRVDDALPANSFRVLDTVVALGDGRLLAERDGVDALLDHARDFAQSTCWIVTHRDGATADVVSSFAAKLGIKVVASPDRPGQIVLRTLVQIANAAADALTDEVATRIDIDSAMMFGANHPEGPLAWAERVGHGTARTALGHIAQATNDRMYAPSAYFEERL